MPSTVASMNFEAEAPRQLGALADALPFGLCGRHPIVGKGVAPRAGVDLDHRRADGERRLNLPRLGGDEQRDADAGLPQSANNGRENLMLAGHIEATLGGALFASLGHEAGGVRAGIDRDPNHFLGRGHFEIERLCNLRLEAGNVVVADVPPVFT